MSPSRRKESMVAGLKPEPEKSVTDRSWEMTAKPAMRRNAYSAHNLHESATNILARRGIGPKEAETFLNPTRENSFLDPYGIRHMDRAVQYITNSMYKGEKIAVLGDYDVDGCTGTAIMQRFFDQMGVKIETYIPHRVNEGYGPNETAVRELAAKGVKTLITVDCGTTSYESLKLAKELGMKVIVTDHHKPIKGAHFPEGAEIINPNRARDSHTPPDVYKQYQVMTGAGVAYLLCEALYDKLDNPDKGRENWFRAHKIEPHRTATFDSLMVLAAMGTHCDVAPMTGINRWMVSEGLKVMNHWRVSQERGLIEHWPIPGLQYLCDVARLKQKEITSDHFGFQLGPRLNAAGRVDHGIYAKNLLATDDPVEAKALAIKCDGYNVLRKEIQKSILDEAIIQAEPQAKNDPVIVVAQRGWHEGVIGIVAGQLKERFGKPAFVITINEDGVAKGSARSIEGVDIGDAVIKALQEKQMLIKGGGHGMAAGFSLHEKEIEGFHAYLNEELGKDVAKANANKRLHIDDVITVADITPALVESYARLAPHGRHNEPPRIVIERTKVYDPRVVGRNNDTLQLSILDAANTRHRANAVLFKKATQPLGIALRNPLDKERVQMAGRVTCEEYQGVPKLQFEVEDAHFGPLEEVLHERAAPKAAQPHDAPAKRTPALKKAKHEIGAVLTPSKRKSLPKEPPEVKDALLDAPQETLHEPATHTENQDARATRRRRTR